MTYKPFKMKGSPMKRNFGIGEKEEISPGKEIEQISLPQQEVSLTGDNKAPEKLEKLPTDVETGKGKEKEEESTEDKSKNKKGKILRGIGDVIQAALDAGAGTSHLAKKKAKRDADKTKEEKAKDDELKHQREMEKIAAMSSPSDENKGAIVDKNGDGIDDSLQELE